MEHYNDAAPKKGFTFWKLVKWGLALVTFAIYLLLTMRACAMDGLKDTSKTRALLRNETLLAAYAKSPDSLTVLAGPEDSISTTDGRLTVTNIRWIDAVDQFQLTIRYNDSLARSIMNEFSLREEPTGEYLTFALRDDAGNLYTAFEYITDEVFVYNFRRLVFDGVQLDDCNTLRLEVYFTGYVNYENKSAPLNSLPVYSKADGLQPYEPKKGELTDSVTQGLLKSRVWTKPITADTESN
jgi:hypothetical protein